MTQPSSRKRLTFAILAAMLWLGFSLTSSAFENVEFSLEIGGPQSGKETGNFNTPQDLVVAGDGTIYVTDSNNSRVQYFDAQGKYLGQFGGKGKEKSSLNSPFGIAIGPQGFIYVSDRSEDLVKVYNGKGEFFFAFGGSGLLKSPCGIALDTQERVLVADSGRHRIAVFTLQGIFLYSFGAQGSGKGELNEPTYVAVDVGGKVYVSEAGNKRLQVFTIKGEPVSIRGGAADPSSPLKNPAGLSVTAKGILAVADQATNQVAMLDPQGKFQTPLGSPGSGRGQFKNAGGIRLLEDGRLFVADSGNHRLEAFKTALPQGLPDLEAGPMALRLEVLKVVSQAVTDLAVAEDGTLYLLDGVAGKVNLVDQELKAKSSFGPEKGAPGNLKKAGGIGLGPGGRVFVYDAADDTFQVFDNQGVFKFAFGGKGKNEGKLDGVKGFCLSQGKLYVADTGNSRVQVFSADGIMMQKIGDPGSGSGQLKDPGDVAVDSKGVVYVADSGNNRVQVFDPQGGFKYTLGRPGSGPSQFNGLRSLALNAYDFLFTLESEGQKNNRVQMFDPKLNLVLTFGSEGNGPGQFSRASNLGVRNQIFSELYINDVGNQRVEALVVKELPDRPAGLTLVNQETLTVLTWNKRPEKFIKGYRVYYLPDDGSLPRALGETTEPLFQVEYPLNPSGHKFRVTALSVQDLESQPSQTVTDNFWLGYLAWKAGDYPTAEDKFLTQFNEFPTSALSLKYLGMVRLARGKPEEALRSFSELSKAPEYAGEAHLQMGRVYIQLKKYPEAEVELKKALDAAPEKVEVYLARGELFLTQSLYREAQREFERAVAKNPQNAQALELLGRCFSEQKLFGKAQETLELAIRLDPKNCELYCSLALVHLGRRDIAGAITVLEKSLEMNPRDANAMVMLGEIYLEQKDYAKVERQINLALAEDPKNFQAQLLRGKLLAGQGKNEDAILAFQDAINLRPDDPEAQEALAEGYLNMNQPLEAEKILRKVILTAPNLASAHLGLARVLADKGEADAAIAEFQKAIELAPKDITLRLALGQQYLNTKQYDLAETQFSSVIAQVPDHVPAHLLLGRVYSQETKIGDAIREYQEAIRLDPKNPDTHFSLGQLFLDTGQYDKAVSELELAAFSAPKRADFQNALGLAYFKMLQYDEAIGAFNKATSLAPDQPEYKKNFNQAYADRQKFLSTEGNAPPLEIVDFQVGNVFSAIYKYYQDQPIGALKLKNNLGEPLYKIKVSFQVAEYMDTAWYYEIPQLNPRSSIAVKIFPVFNNKVLELTEDSPVLAEIIARYQVQKQSREEKITRPFTLLKKSALTWSKKEMTGAFITTSDTPVKEFARGVYTLYSKDQFSVNEQIAHAMMIFDALNAYKLNYLADPNNPYGAASGGAAVDYVQYPRETLRLRSGDCDDLSILFCALLENLGIPTAMVDVPGHVFIIFGTEVPAQRLDLVTSQPELVVINQGKVWIPLETTFVGKNNFTGAWIKGAEVYRKWEAQKKLSLIDTHASWEVFKPATLPPTDFLAKLPSRAEIDKVLAQEKSLQESKQKDQIATVFQERLRQNPKDLEARLQLGLAYAENGYLTEAKTEFETILKQDPKNVGALANLGSCALANGNFQEAIQRYGEAVKLAPEDAEIKINLAIAFYKSGNLELARSNFMDARALDEGLVQKFKSLESMLFH